MSGQEKKGLSEDYPQEYSSYQSIDIPYLDEISSETSARVPSTSTEDLTGPRRQKCVPRISRTRSMDRYRPDRRSTRSTTSTGGSRKTRRTCSARRSASLRPADLLTVPKDFRRQSVRIVVPCDAPGSRRGSSSLSAVIARKERRRRRKVLIIMIVFFGLALASLLAVVVTLTHSSTVSVDNTTSKYYTFAAPPHHPLIRQENERMIHESFNSMGNANMTQPTAAEKEGVVDPH